MQEALDGLKPPKFFKSKAIIIAQCGKLTAELYMWPFQLRKLFVNPMMRVLLAKRLSNILK